ncbi:Coa1p SCDLUD_005316 [Saccharomycodes ludwigii]|uniref:Coa1p n=1 Tax=Saccharomycodes ludwigii TaxID=36035 RepID=UPI001E88E38C|nr:hypothetical protein SCDLUD_005316 [Saccharomycodes ludwigii]KAH3898969.1 hypothetical protein SCDLUD_005316 [Saccharomycodes ludwigii]
MLCFKNQLTKRVILNGSKIHTSKWLSFPLKNSYSQITKRTLFTTIPTLTQSPGTLPPINDKLEESNTKKKRPMTVNDTLPDPFKDKLKNRVQFIVFVVTTTIALLCLFNYEKTQSPIVTNTLYQLRRSQRIRELLGNNIDFEGLFPWVFGELNQVAGKINITFYVKGTKGVRGTVRLVADKNNEFNELFIKDWSITIGNEKINLVDEEENAKIE